MSLPPGQPHSPDDPARIRPSGWEWFAATGAALLLLAFHILSYNLYPAVWCDEVSFSEPAVNLVKYGSFTTQVWQHQPLNMFPTVNCPLYSMALAPWLSVFGTTLLAVRSFNYALMTVAAVLVWVLSWRFGLVKTPLARVLAVVALELGYGMSYTYRCSRPDILGMVLLLLLLLTLFWRRSTWIDALVVLLCAAMVWVGLQVALYAAFAAFTAWVLFRKIHLRQLFLMAGGFGCGAITLGLFLWWHGVLSNLLLIVTGMGGRHYAHIQHTTVAAKISKVVSTTVRSYFDDFSTLLLLAGLAAALVPAWRGIKRGTRHFVLFCLMLIVSTPALFNVAGHYAFYYSYMLFVPALLACLTLSSELARLGRIVAIGSVVLASLIGLPMRLGIALTCFDLVPRPFLRQQLSAQISPKDVVFSDYAVFFETKAATRTVYDLWSSADLMPTHIPGRSFSTAEKAAVSVLVIRPENHERLATYFGGSWEAVTPPFGDRQDFSRLEALPVIGRRFAHHAAQPQTARYQLQVYRRDSR